MATLALKDKDISQFASKFGIVLIVLFILELLSFNLVSLVVSIAGHGFLLYFCYQISTEFKSDLPKFMLAAVLLAFFGELCILSNLDFSIDNKGFWAFIVCHFLRNLVISGRLFLNIYKSDINNYFWLKILPYPCVAVLFLLLEIFIFGKETENFFVFLIYNAVICLPVLMASLRQNHTSYRGFPSMILATLSLVVSDIFYFVRILEKPEDPVSISFRATFLLLGNAAAMFASYDHVTEFEQESRNKIYAAGGDTESSDFSKLRGKVLVTPRKPLEEPLV